MLILSYLIITVSNLFNNNKINIRKYLNGFFNNVKLRIY